MTEEKYYSISEAVALLHPEFPDLTPSSLRYLEKEGLLHPQRTQGRHRLYSGEDIARIRLIKHLQAERYYPLDTIRHMLFKLEQARDMDAEMSFLESLYRPLTYDPHFVPPNQEQLADHTGLSVADIIRLEKMGMLFPYSNGDGPQRYDEDDVKVAELVAQEMRLGASLDDFAPYAAVMQALVREEFTLFNKLAGDRLPTPERARQLKETADLVHTLLRAKLTRQLLAQIKQGKDDD